MRIEDTLKLIGLDENEARVYLACLQLGENTVYNIAKKSELKRPTVYLILENLSSRGLLGVLKTKKHLLYSPLHPRKLADISKNRQKRIEEIIPNLIALYKEKGGKPSVQIFEGRKGIETIYQDCCEYLSREEEILIVGSITQFRNYRYLLHIWEEKIKEGKGKYRIRELNNNDELSRDYHKKMKKYCGENYQIKFLPLENSFINCDMSIYGNKVVIYSHDYEMVAIVIESKNISQSFKKLFNIVWNIGEY